MDKARQDGALRKAFLHLLPVLVLAYLAAYLDRVNIANAALTMNADIGLSVGMYGLGSGLFFVTYFVFGPPSNLLMQRFGARLWMAPMVLLLGLFSMAMAFVQGPASFLTVRLLLGAAEAGFFPGVILFITYWFPAAARSRVTAAFTIAIPASLAIAGPVSNAILHMAGLLGFKGWQWMFLMEGGATVILGVIMFFCLSDKPADVAWLDAEEKQWLAGELEREAAQVRAHQPPNLWLVLANRQTLLLAYIYLANITTNLGTAFFLPLILKSMGASATQANTISAIPFVAGVAGILFFGALADRFKTRRIAILRLSLGVSALGLAAAGLAASGAADFAFGGGKLAIAYAAIFFIALAALGIYGTKAPFWPLPSLFLTGSAAALGIGVINAVGNLGGFVGPAIVAFAQGATKSYVAGLYALAMVGASAVLATFFLALPRGGFLALPRVGD